MLLLHREVPVFEIRLTVLPIRDLGHLGLVSKHARHGLLQGVTVFEGLQLLEVAEGYGAAAQLHNKRVLGVQLSVSLELIGTISLTNELIIDLVILLLVG